MELNQTLISELKNIFIQEFGSESKTIFSPGRINLLGEHIDYNDGYVLPAAIQLGIYACFAPTGNSTIEIIAKDFNNRLRIDVSDIGPASSWQNYVLSVLNQFKIKGITIPGFQMVFGGDLPIGSGLSSSAALEGAISFVVNHLSGAGFTAKQLALLGQAAEHDYPGVKCGIMDQFANMLGKEDNIVRIDCMTQDTDYLPLRLHNYSLVLIYSNVQHALTGGEYNQRREQCNEGLAHLKNKTGKSSFRNITHEELESAKAELNPVVYSRCKYVVDEIERTHLAAEALQKGNLVELGSLMFQTHWGLSRLYDVSLPELDWLVNFAEDFEGVLGSRLMGGGFGGCTLNLVARDKTEAFISEAIQGYHTKFGIHAKAYPVLASDGTWLVEA
jgi:galactokinase